MLFKKKTTYIVIIIVFLAGNSSFSGFNSYKAPVIPTTQESLYELLDLSALGLKENIFHKAVRGWKNLTKEQKLENSSVLSIADLSQSSNAKRLYVIDMDKKTVLFNTYVAHGRNSGEEYACSFANKPESFKSSLGFYRTGDTYVGSHGLSLKLQGFEKGINDQAEQRKIVMHGAPYVSSSHIEQFGRLGRSLGCPAVSQELCEPIINSIKNGSCLFMFYPDSTYFKKSCICKESDNDQI